MRNTLILFILSLCCLGKVCATSAIADLGTYSLDEITDAEIAHKLTLYENKTPDEIRVIILVDWVYRISTDLEIARRGIVVTDEEAIAKRMEALGDLDKAVSDLNDRIRKLPPAWHEARANPDREKEIYERDLKELLRYSQWKAYLDKGGGEETIRRMEMMQPVTKEDFYHFEEGDLEFLKRSIAESRLNDALESELRASIDISEEKLRQTHGGMGFEGTFEEVREKIIEIELGTRRGEWKQDQRLKRINPPDLVIHDAVLREQYYTYLQNQFGRDKIRVPVQRELSTSSSYSGSSNEAVDVSSSVEIGTMAHSNGVHASSKNTDKKDVKSTIGRRVWKLIFPIFGILIVATLILSIGRKKDL